MHVRLSKIVRVPRIGAYWFCNGNIIKRYLRCTVNVSIFKDTFDLNDDDENETNCFCYDGPLSSGERLKSKFKYSKCN